MKKSDFTTTIEVEQSPEDVFNAICNVSKWWHGEIKGKSGKMGDGFDYRFENIHFSEQKVKEFIPNKKLVWFVTKSKLDFTEDKSEWTGTEIIFEISEIKNKTRLRFTHKGLTPKFECYEACSNGWNMLIQKSLLSLINTGKGKKVF